VTAAKDHRAPFERVADELRARITSGELAAGERLPSGRELADQHGIALATAQSALKRLRDENLAVSTPRGYFVSGERPDKPEDLRRDLDATRAELRLLTERVERLEQATDR
jgi:DNA-binding transcriptional regulator YhcF (GntR family)